MTSSLKELRIFCLISLLTLGALPFAAAQTPSNGVGVYRANDARTGLLSQSLNTPLSVIWQNTTQASDQNTSGPVDDNGVLFYATGGTVYAVNEDDGSIKWQYPAADAPSGPDVRKPSYFHCSPCVADGKVFIGNDDGNLYALDEQSGEDIFQVKTGGAIRSAPVVDNGIVYFGSEDSYLYDIRESDQKEAWGGRFKAAGPIFGPIVVTPDQVVFADTNNGVYAASKSNGRLLWSYNAIQGVVDQAPMLVGDTVVIATNRQLLGLSDRNGQQVWQSVLSTIITNQASANSDGTVFYVPTADYYLNAVNSRGQVLWRAALDSPCAAGPIIAGNTVVLAVKSGSIFAFNADNGSRTWSYSLNAISPPGPQYQNRNGSISVAPLVSNGKIFAIANNSTLTALASRGFDNVSPVATLEYPSETQTVAGSQIPYTILLQDLGSGIDPKTIVLKVDGKIVPTDYSVGSQILSVKTVTAGTVGRNPVRLATLVTGKHVLILTAADWRGNTLTKTWRFTTDSRYNPPTASLPPTNSSGDYATQSGTDAEFVSAAGGNPDAGSGGYGPGGGPGTGYGGPGGGYGGGSNGGSTGGNAGPGGSSGGNNGGPPPNLPPPAAPPGTGGNFPPPPPI